jgi:hypothetical protein
MKKKLHILLIASCINLGSLSQPVKQLAFSKSDFWGTGIIGLSSPSTFNFDEKLGIASGGNPDRMTLVEHNGLLYGTLPSLTSDKEYVFSYNPSTEEFKINVVFDDEDGIHPINGVVKAADGQLYGVCERGGLFSFGTLYTPIIGTSGIETRVHFDGGGPYSGFYPKEELLVANDNSTIFGSTNGQGTGNIDAAIFEYDYRLDGYQSYPLPPGVHTETRFVEHGNKLYFGSGTELYTFHKFTHEVEALNFNSYYPGPNSVLIELEKNGDDLLILTSDIGPSQFTRGFIYKMPFATGIPERVHELFSQDVGQQITQKADLKINANKEIYCLITGGQSTKVMIYDEYDVIPLASIDLPSSGTIGNASQGGIYHSNDGNSYITCTSGGLFHAGSVVKYDRSANVATELFAFGNGPFGRETFSTPLQVSKKYIVGSTLDGGEYKNGTMFSFNYLTKEKEVIVAWKDDSTGYFVSGEMVHHKDKVYGANTYRKLEIGGTLFAVEPLTKTFTKLYEFDSPTIVEGNIHFADSVLYAVQTTNDRAALFSYDLRTSSYVFMDSLPIEMRSKHTNCYLSADSTKLYFYNNQGAVNDKGCLGVYDINGQTFSVLLSFSDTLSKVNDIVETSSGKIVLAGKNTSVIPETYVYYTFNSGASQSTLIVERNQDMGHIPAYTPFYDPDNADEIFYSYLTSANSAGGVILKLDLSVGTIEEVFNGTNHDLEICSGLVGINPFFKDGIEGLGQDELDPLTETTNQVKIFPNPNNGQFTYRVDHQMSKGQLMIYSASGQFIQTKTINNKVGSVSLQLESGIYLLKVVSDDGLVSNGRFVID